MRLGTRLHACCRRGNGGQIEEGLAAEAAGFMDTTSGEPARPIAPLWRSAMDPELRTLRKVLRNGCDSGPDSRRNNRAKRSSGEEPSASRGEKEDDEENAATSTTLLRLWLQRSRRSRSRSHGQRIFPELDLFLTRHACVDLKEAFERVGGVQDRGLHWYAGVPEGSQLLPRAKASGIELLQQYGALCGGGVRLAAASAFVSDGTGEVAVVPCINNTMEGLAASGAQLETTQRGPQRRQNYVMEAYALELMEPRPLPHPSALFSSPRGATAAASTRTRRGDGVAVFLGEVPNNPGHWVHLSVWLYKVATSAALHAILKAHPGPLKLVPTKYAAAQCDSNGVFCSLRSLDLTRMPHAWQLLQPALEAFSRRGIAVEWEDLVSEAEQSETAATRCFDLAIQPWREWPGDSRVYDRVRRSLAGSCGFQASLPKQLARRAVAFERTSQFRPWHADTRRDVQDALVRFGQATDFAIDWVVLGLLPVCAQLKVVASSSLMIGIAGAEHAHAAFMPRGGALLEVDPFCAPGTDIRAATGSAGAAEDDDTARVARATRLSRCCKSNFALGQENCAPLPELPSMETAWRWRGPGLLFRSEIWRRVSTLAAKDASQGGCMGANASATACDGEPGRRWAPYGRWAELARARALAYIAIVRCKCHEGPRGSGTNCGHLFQQGALEVDVQQDLLPALFALHDEHLRSQLVARD
eukprot:TRINITY_DN19846_c0_g1_i1.p1 TRINITY_DN19846_c0_g1~~TRINITY_DN19846_c0_g1_i1.p1  ORF type:complete len:700 (+),score=93.43 TRINITY_DN19846_c0_g1_i1:383-2482(+)